MKRILLFTLLIFFAFGVLRTNAQTTKNASIPYIKELNYKFGKVSKQELVLKEYVPDSTAKAVVLAAKCEMYYDYVNGLILRTDYYFRVKVLEENEEDLANISFFYYKSSNNTSAQDRITGVKGVSYNLEKGKIVKSKLDKDYIYKEEVDENTYRFKFTMPNVKKGTVFEYKYSITSRRPWVIPSWNFQRRIPVDYVSLETTFPEFMTVNLNMKGWQHIVRNVKQVRDDLTAGGAYCNRITYSAYQVPALRDEPFVWCLDNYRSQISFNLTGIRYADMSYKDYSNSWEKVRDAYYNSSSFGGNIKRKSRMKIEVDDSLFAKLSIEDKAMLAFNLVSKAVKWNGSYGMACKDIKGVLNSGEGNNAAINFLSMNLLRDWGVETLPVALCTKDEGLFPFVVMDNVFDTFVVAIKSGDHYLFMDGSNKYGFLNFLPLKLNVERALLMPKKGATSFVNLEFKKKSNLIINLKSSIDEDGILKANVTTTGIGYQSCSGQASYQKMKKDSIAFIEAMEKEEGVTMLSYGPNMFKRGKMMNSTQYSFEKELQVAGDLIYLNPMVIPHISEQPFKAKERKFPIEFPYTSRVLINSLIQIPEGYVVEELPKAIHATTPGNVMQLFYKVQVSGNLLQLSYRYELNKKFFLADQYELLKSFWTQMVKCNNAMIVLKRKEIQNHE